MKLARNYLIGLGAISLAAGLAYLVSPVALTEAANFGDLAPAAKTDIRATYGGLQIGLGAFLVWCGLSADRHRTGLVLAVVSMGSILLGRMLGVALDGAPNSFHMNALAFESLITAASALVLRKIW